jgi:hypothetical protein
MADILVDPEDEWLLRDFSVYFHKGDKYVRIYSKETGKRYLHRVITGATKGMDVDHINGDRLDNRRSNLRVCSRSENMKNARKRSRCSSKYKGVTWVKSKKRWRAQITMVECKGSKHIGYFKSEIDAARAYNEAAKEYFGEFAKINDLPEVRAPSED